MRLLVRPLAALTVLAITVAVPVLPQQPARSAKEIKIERLLRAMKMDETFDATMDSLRTTLTMQAFPPDAPPELRARTAAMQDRVLAILKPKLSFEVLLPRYIQLYSETFSDDEIDGIAAFYESPAGRAFIAKTPALTLKLMPLLQEIIRDVQPEIMRIAREEIEKGGPGNGVPPPVRLAPPPPPPPK